MVNTDPGFFAGLAEEFFADNGIRLLTDVANWADLCTAPRGTPVQHPDSGINNHVFDENPAFGHQSQSLTDNRPGNLPMANVAIDRFFTAARALSGPEIGKFAAPNAPHLLLQDGFRNLGSNLTNKPGGENDAEGGLMGLHDALDRLFENWRGSGADACRDYAGSVYTFMSHELEVIGGLVDAITAYCSVIVAARRRLIGLMRAFVGAMKAKEAEDVAEDQQFPWGLLAAGLATVVSMGFGLAALAAEATAVEIADAVLPPLAGMAATTADKLLDAGDKQIPATDYAVAAQAYLTLADQVVDETRAAIEPITRQISEAARTFMEPPAPPITKVKFEAQPHALEPASTS
ncbi:hypothetical protein ACIOD2_44425 [Amycolatopsis sp. NPDC088138]|uniref:hypothetical protein n=1 Tax=Amycolatopsis sp. NPDC088138 TaxID=3363938 RepID=UPI0037FAD0CB